ncbi:MAG: hypothetical protein JO262_03480 [Solirubrobacterales bacterium]|nr:hypothetical protein [Solirubrobacterales bacterium]
MYGHHHFAVASIVPVSLGTALTVGWVFMAVVTVLFLIASLGQLVRPVRGAKP